MDLSNENGERSDGPQGCRSVKCSFFRSLLRSLLAIASIHSTSAHTDSMHQGSRMRRSISHISNALIKFPSISEVSEESGGAGAKQAGRAELKQAVLTRIESQVQPVLSDTNPMCTGFRCWLLTNASWPLMTVADLDIPHFHHICALRSGYVGGSGTASDRVRCHHIRGAPNPKRHPDPLNTGSFLVKGPLCGTA